MQLNHPECCVVLWVKGYYTKERIASLNRLFHMKALTPKPLPDLLKTLSHHVRWQIVQALMRSDCRVQELVQILGHPMNLISYHLKPLRDYGLVESRRSEADARDVYNSLGLQQLQQLYYQTGHMLHIAGLDAPVTSPQLAKPLDQLAGRRFLFLCTHNAARSQMAEGILRHITANQVEVFSAGTEPAHIHPMAIQVMDEMEIDISNQQSKAIERFICESFDYVITVCDRAREACPTFPGNSEMIHWSIPDPVAPGGDEDYQDFIDVAQQLARRIPYFLHVINDEF